VVNWFTRSHDSARSSDSDIRRVGSLHGCACCGVCGRIQPYWAQSILLPDMSAARLGMKKRCSEGYLLLGVWYLGIYGLCEGCRHLLFSFVGCSCVGDVALRLLLCGYRLFICPVSNAVVMGWKWQYSDKFIRFRLFPNTTRCNAQLCIHYRPQPVRCTYKIQQYTGGSGAHKERRSPPEPRRERFLNNKQEQETAKAEVMRQRFSNDATVDRNLKLCMITMTPPQDITA